MLAVIDVYGVTSYDVSQRARNRLRLALGADRHAVVGLVLRDGLTMAGVAAGAALAMAMARLTEDLLFGVSPYDPVTYVGLAMVLAVATAYLPARRATVVNPLDSWGLNPQSEIRSVYRLARGS